MKGKKGSGVIWFIAIVLVVFMGMFAWFNWIAPARAGGTGDTTNTGIASFKVAVEDSSATKARYAGTAYCWKEGATTLLGTGSITLSASQATAVPSVNLQNTIHCIAFDSTHLGVEKSVKVTEEGQEMTLESKNISPSSFSLITRYAGNDETNATASAGGSVSLEGILLSASADYKGYNFKTLCVTSNASNSEVKAISVDGMSPSNSIPYTYRNNATGGTCFNFPTAQFIGGTLPRANRKPLVGAVQIDMTSSFTTDEQLSFCFLGEHQYTNRNNFISTGIQTDTDTPSLILTPVCTNFKVAYVS